MKIFGTLAAPVYKIYVYLSDIFNEYKIKIEILTRRQTIFSELNTLIDDFTFEIYSIFKINNVF